MPDSIRVRSYAKINWFLDVLYRRRDGYHEIRTLFQTISLFDTLTISRTGGEIEVVCCDTDVPSGELNLAWRAFAAAQETFGLPGGLRIEIEKRIPVAAGLAGGSSNAAATLLAVARLFGIEVDDKRLGRIAVQLGSDVGFFLVGGSAMGAGRGEEVYPAEEVRHDQILLANPRIHIVTGRAYENLTRLTWVPQPRMIPILLLAAGGILVTPPELRNSLEEAVMMSTPEIRRLKTRILDLGARGALMSGSGATVFGLFDNLEASERAVVELSNAGLWVEKVRTIGRAEYWETIFSG
jgi:4-diphosphocytidyl-2-C-methyl-D-erythritol kinase